MSGSDDWARMNDEYGEADAEMRAAQAVVTAKFMAIGRGTSTENPTSTEMGRVDAAAARLNDITRRMQDFMRKHFGV